jgi:RHH-type proline utilization regulon transcriptional repressor/proline dehydrogenase/delta 1-pyrroline-5-carboxylate dehydrogenase
VIDAAARDGVLEHIDAQRRAGRAVWSCPLPDECARGSFVAPTLVDLGGIDGLAALDREVFGPVLHFLRWRRDELPALVDAINATGYGLTHGIHSRIDETVAAILGRVRAGNVYVNRNMIGAVVGVQPFGGCGLSGTGPKAGGPLYVARLMAGAAAAVPTDGRSRIELPGPTGESNVLEIVPRGAVACLADDERALRAQARAAIAAGNTAVLLRSHVGLAVRDACETSRAVLADELDPAAVDAVLLDAKPERARRVRAELAAAPGAIVPVIVPDAQGRYDPARLVAERTVTVNTSATGGNAALLSLAEGSLRRAGCARAAAPRPARRSVARPCPCACSTPTPSGSACRGRGCSPRSTRRSSSRSRRRCASTTRSRFRACPARRCC